MGAWPVFGFFGLDVLLLYWAFKLNYRHAAAYEEVKVTPAALTVRKVSHRGVAREWVLNPLWVKLDKVVHEEFGIERLFLVSRGKELAIASFLGPDEKASFAKALGAALSEAKRGVTRTVFLDPRRLTSRGGIRRQKSGGFASLTRPKSAVMTMTHEAMTPAQPALPGPFGTLSPLATAAADYDVVRRAIAHIRGNWRAQPEIEHHRPMPPASRPPTCIICSAAGAG